MEKPQKVFLQVIQLSEYLLKGHNPENSLIWMFIHPLFWLYGSPLISYSVTVRFPLKRKLPTTAVDFIISFFFSCPGTHDTHLG